MPYNPQFLTDLHDIILDIDAGRIFGAGEAFTKFQAYITQAKNIGRYSIGDWRTEYTDKVYQLGKRFDKIDPIQFLTALDNEINNSTFIEKELLYFIKSEILWNFENHNKQEKYLTDLLTQYVNNAEIYHTLGHLKTDKKLFIEAIECYSQAIKINPLDKFFESKWNAEVLYVEQLIENEEYELAETLINDRINKNIYRANLIRHNWMVFLSNRIKDYKLQDKKAIKKQNEIQNLLNNEFQSERKKVIELLGLFTAIIAFIFMTVTVAKTFEYEQAINFITCLGLVLIVFTLTISIIFHEKKIRIYKDIRLYIVLILSILIFLILSSTTLVHEGVKNFSNY